MKKIFITTLAFLALSTYSVHAQTQEINQTTKTQKGIILYGKQNLEPFSKKPFKAWFDEEYTPYVVDQPSIKNWKKNLSAYEIVIYPGSWCPDSHREFPRFIKILQELKYPENQLQIYALDREKKDHMKKKSFIMLLMFLLLL